MMINAKSAFVMIKPNILAILILYIFFLVLPSYSYAQENMLDDAIDFSGLDDDSFYDEIEEEGNSSKSSMTIHDPFPRFNKAVFNFNDKLYIHVFKPFAMFYDFVVPSVLQKGLSNFFDNLKSPLRSFNCVLQGKFKNGFYEILSFGLDSTLGFFGFFKPSSTVDALNPPEEDFGQTLAFYGYKESAYIVLPILGPSTFRDLFSNATEIFYLSDYLDPMEVSFNTDSTEEILLYGLGYSNMLSAQIKFYEDFKKMSVDPYEAFKNGYIQRRNAAIAK